MTEDEERIHQGGDREDRAKRADESVLYAAHVPPYPPEDEEQDDRRGEDDEFRERRGIDRRDLGEDETESRRNRPVEPIGERRRLIKRDMDADRREGDRKEYERPHGHYPENAALFGNIATDEYYDSAMKYFMSKDPDTHFYIFTNDPAYAKDKYSDPGRYTIVEHNTGKYSLLDIQLMSHCRGNICANSTFSFWGARLNRRKDKEMVRTFTMRNNQPCDPDLMHYYWDRWILIDKDGKVR